jgi:hypothetical protein
VDKDQLRVLQVAEESEKEQLAVFAKWERNRDTSARLRTLAWLHSDSTAE